MKTNFNLLYEEIVHRTGRKSIDRQDISNVIYSITDGGRELFSVYTVRKNDSKTDPSKRAGDVMKITGKLGSCKATRNSSVERRPELSTPVQYAKNAILRMCVTSVDGVDYVSRYPAERRTRSFDVTEVTKIEAGNIKYDIV